MPIYEKASEELINSAERIIDKSHTGRDLENARIGFLFRQGDAPISKGKTVYGKAKIPPAELSAYADLDFIIWISEEMWNKSDKKRRAWMIDHELCHLDYTDEEAAIRHHDFEEFSQIIERHGLINPDIFNAARNFAVAIQDELPGWFKKSKGEVIALDPKAMNKPKAAAAT